MPTDAQQHVPKLELTKDTVDQLASKVDEAENPLGASQEHVHYFEEKLADQSNPVLAKEAEATNERDRLSKPEVQVMSLPADLQQARAPNATEKNLLEGIRTALALQKTASQQRISSYVEERKKSVGDKATIDVECR